MSDGAAESPYERLVENLRSIEAWVASNAQLPVFRNNDEFMAFAVEIMNRAHYVLKVGVSLVPGARAETSGRGVPRRRAVALGHVVRLMKLYDSLTLHTCKRQLEIGMIFFRLILETAIRLQYLLTAKRSSFRNFILISYRPEKEHLVDLQGKAKQRRLLPIERRIISSIRGHIRSDGVRVRELLANRCWDLDGKNFRAILRDTGQSEWGYSYGFGNGSHFVHGDWRDMTMHHLVKRGRFYQPKWQYSTPDPRLVCPATTICLEVLHRFITWNGSDPDKYVRQIIEGLLAVNTALDDAHERHLQERLQRTSLEL